MIFEQAEDFRRADTGDGLLEMITSALPDGDGVQLLRSLSDPTLKQGRYADQHCPRLLEMGVQTGPRDRCLFSVLHPVPHQDISLGQLVIASLRALGWASRTNKLRLL